MVIQHGCTICKLTVYDKTYIPLLYYHSRKWSWELMTGEGYNKDCLTLRTLLTNGQSYKLWFLAVPWGDQMLYSTIVVWPGV